MIPAQAENPYEVLGLQRDAGEAEIKRAYFQLVRQHPPERDPEGFKRIRSAYEKLKNTEQRAGTDLFTIEDGPATIDLAALQEPDAEPPPVTVDGVVRDLICLEALLMLEDLHSPPANTRGFPRDTGPSAPEVQLSFWK